MAPTKNNKNEEKTKKKKFRKRNDNNNFFTREDGVKITEFDNSNSLKFKKKSKKQFSGRKEIDSSVLLKYKTGDNVEVRI